MKFNIRLLYLYLFSFIGLLITVIGSVQLVDLAIKVYIFKGADEYEYAIPAKIDPNGKEITLSKEEETRQKEMQQRETRRQRQRQVSNALAMILIGIPLYKYHWNTIKKEGKSK